MLKLVESLKILEVSKITVLYLATWARESTGIMNRLLRSRALATVLHLAFLV